MVTYQEAEKIEVGDVFWYNVGDDILPVEVIGINADVAEVKFISGTSCFWTLKRHLLIKRAR